MRLHTLEKYIIYSFLFIFAVHILFSINVGSSYTLTRIIVILMLTFLILYYLEEFNKSQNLLQYQFIYFFFLYLFIQSYFSTYINTKFEYFQHQLIVFYLFLFTHTQLILHNINVRFSIKKFLLITTYTFLVLLVFILIYSLIKRISPTNSIEILFDNRRFFNHIQTIMTPILLYMLFTLKSRFLKTIFAFIFFFNIFLIFNTGARGTLYSLILASFIIYVTSIQNKKVKHMIIVLHILFIASFIFQQYIDSLNLFENSHSEHFKSVNSSGRFYIYSTLSNYIFDKNYIFTSIGFASQDVAQTGFLHPHNLILYIFLGSGTFGLVVFLYIFINYLYLCSKKNLSLRHNQNSLYKIFYFTFLAVFFHSLLSGIYITPLVSIFIFYFLIMYHQINFVQKKFISTDIYPKTTLLNLYLNKATKVILFLIVLYSFYLIKQNLDLFIFYNGLEHHTNIPGIFMFNERIY